MRGSAAACARAAVRAALAVATPASTSAPACGASGARPAVGIGLARGIGLAPRSWAAGYATEAAGVAPDGEAKKPKRRAAAKKKEAKPKAAKDGPKKQAKAKASSKASSADGKTTPGTKGTKGKGGASAGSDAGSGSSAGGEPFWAPYVKGAANALRGAFQASVASDAYKSARKQADGALEGRMRRAGAVVIDELKEIFDLKESTTSATRRRPFQDDAAGGGEEYTGPTDVSIHRAEAKRPESPWEREWDKLKQKAKRTPLYKQVKDLSGKVKESDAMRRFGDRVEDLRDRWETSDSRLVQKIQDSLEETDTAIVMKEIMARDPDWELNRFIRDLKGDALPIMNAYLTYDVEFLKEHSGPELLERVVGMRTYLQSQGLIHEFEILDLKDVAIAGPVTLEWHEESPMMNVFVSLQVIEW